MPGVASVGGFVDAPFAASRPERAFSSDQDGVAIARVDQDLGNMLGTLQPHEVDEDQHRQLLGHFVEHVGLPVGTDLLDQFDGVLESAVIGLPHPDFGEAVVAVIVPIAGAPPDEPAVIAHSKRELANFKVPKRVFFVDELPRNAMGKVQKNLLRERYAGIFSS